MNLSDALAIDRIALQQRVARHGLLNPRVYGSVLIQTDTEDSDPDVLVDSVPGSKTLFTRSFAHATEPMAWLCRPLSEVRMALCNQQSRLTV
jgi:predicted nucleotidyltransferase